MIALTEATVRLGETPANKEEAIRRAAVLLAEQGGSNAAVLGLILGGMMATDMGGPLNKVAYTFAVGLITSGVGVSTVVPHGGIFVFFVPNAMEKPLAWLGALVVGTAITTAVLCFTKRPVEQPAARPSFAAATA